MDLPGNPGLPIKLDAITRNGPPISQHVAGSLPSTQTT